MSKFLILFILTCSFLISENVAQPLQFHRIGITEGLSQSTVNSMVQDEKGFVWIGTQDGLNRYDGRNFKTFRSDGPEGLTSNWISSLSKDSRGNLLVGTRGGGLAWFNPYTEQFHKIELPTELHSDQHKNVITVYVDEFDLIFVSFLGHGMVRFKIDSLGAIHHFEEYVSDESLSESFQVNHFAPFGDSYLALSTTGAGLMFYDREKGVLIGEKQVLMSQDTLKSSTINVSRATQDSGIWVGTDGDGLFNFNVETKQWSKVNLEPQIEGDIRSINVLVKDRSGFLWVGTEGNGIYRWRQGRTAFQKYINTPTDPQSVSDNTIYSCMIDADDRIWFGTYLGGISLFDTQKNRFISYKHVPGDSNTPADNKVKAIEVDGEGNLWLGMRSAGVDIYSLKTFKIEHLPIQQGNYGLLDKSVNTINKLVSGNFLIGYWGSGFSIYDKKSNKFEHHPYQKSRLNLPDGRARVVFQDSKKRIWMSFGTSGVGGLIITDEKLNVLHRFYAYTASKDSLPDNSINSIIQTSDGQIMLGSYGGLSIVNEKLGKITFTTFKNNPQSETSLAGDIVSNIYQDSKNRIWVSSYGGGLNQMVRRGAVDVRFSRITQNDGLPTNGLFGSIEDTNGDLWISTIQGLVKFRPETKKIDVFTTVDGLPSNQFNQGAFNRTDDGLLLFGSLSGLVLFTPEFLGNEPKPARPVIVDVEIFGKSIVTDTSIPYLKSLNIPYEDNLLTLAFTGLDYGYTGKPEYKYRLRGLNENWTSVSGRNFVNYTNLRPGEYFFELRTLSKTGMESEEIASLRLNIVPPFYLTKLFFFLVALSFIGMGYGYTKWRNARLLKRNLELERNVSERTKELQEKTKALEEKTHEAESANAAKSSFLAGMSHELRTPLNAILGFSQILYKASDLSLRYREYAEIMYRSGNHLLNMINDVLDISKIEAGRMELKNRDFDLHSLLNDVGNMFKLQGKESNVRFEWSIEDNLPNYVNADNNKLRQILINVIGNAFKFTVKGGITLTAKMARFDQIPNLFYDSAHSSHNNEDVLIVMEVRDSGFGIEKERIQQIFEPFRQEEAGSESGTGLGLAITSQLLKLMGGEVRVESELNSGSYFLIMLPFTPATKAAIPNEKQEELIVGIKNDRKLTVLVVDDVQSNIDLLRSMLEEVGFTMFEADRGETALKLFELNHFDLLLFDLRMPGMRGEELAGHIRNSDKGQNVPIMAITASVFEDQISKQDLSLFNAILYKPFHQNDLFAKIEQISDISFIREQPGKLSTSETEEDQIETLVGHILGLPDEVRFDLVDAIEASDLDAISSALEDLDNQKVFSVLSKACKEQNFRFVLNLADFIERKSL